MVKPSCELVSAYSPAFLASILHLTTDSPGILSIHLPLPLYVLPLHDGPPQHTTWTTPTPPQVSAPTVTSLDNGFGSHKQTWIFLLFLHSLPTSAIAVIC